MGYIKAEEVLPKEVIEMIQQYVDGANIYIPRREDNRVSWGQLNQAKERIYARDKNIFQEYKKGMKVSELAKKYFLSEKSIWRILRKMKDNC